jgi:hypothetical protein
MPLSGWDKSRGKGKISLTKCENLLAEPYSFPTFPPPGFFGVSQAPQQCGFLFR